MFIQLRYTLGLLLLFFVTTVWAEVAVPTLAHRITDLTATLTAAQSTALENKLAAFEAKKGSQIAVLILPTTQPETIEAFGIRVFDTWKIGRKNINDGVILIVAKDDHKLRLEVGRGLEGAIPDAIAKRILAETIKPYFKNNDYAGGIHAGVNQIIELIEEEKLSEVTAEPMARWEVLVILALEVLVGIVSIVFMGCFFLAVIRGITTSSSNDWSSDNSSKIFKIFGHLIFILIIILGFLNSNLAPLEFIMLIAILGYYLTRKKSYFRNSGFSNDVSNDGSGFGGDGGDFSGGGGESGGGGASDSW